MMIIPALNDNAVLTVQRLLPASRERVFRAWTEPDALEKWFRPGGLGITIQKLDLRVGGFFRFDLADGHDSLSGRYLEIVRPEKLVFTWSSLATRQEETLVTIQFLPRHTQTQVVLTHARLYDDATCAMHQAGWQILLAQISLVLLPFSDAHPAPPPFLCNSCS